MGNRCSVDVDADNGARHLAQQRTSVTFAARDVENATSGQESSRENVAMPMLVRNLTFCSRNKSFAGEWESCRHCVTDPPARAHAQQLGLGILSDRPKRWRKRP